MTPLSMPESGIQSEIEQLQARLAAAEASLAEAQELINAIQSGDVDAVVVSGPEGEQVFTLQGAEYAYRALVETMNEGAATLGADGSVLYCNEHLSILLGLPIEQIVGNQASPLFGDEADNFYKLFVDALCGDNAKAAVDLHTSEGIILPVQVSLRAMKTDDPAAICMVVTDLTDIRKSEKALRESQSFFATLANLVPQFVWMCSPSGANFYFNQRWVDYTGMTLEESYGTGWNTPFHPDERQAAWDAWNLSTRTHQQYRVESRIRAADGTYRWFLMCAEPLEDVEGNVIRWFGTCTDIDDMKRAEAELKEHREHLETLVTLRTNQLQVVNSKLEADIAERKQVDNALRASEEKYRSLFDTLLEGFCIIEVIFDAQDHPVDYRFLEVNPSFEKQTGLHNAQGKLMREFAPDHEAYWFEIYGKVALTGEPICFDNEAKALNMWYQVSAYRVGGPNSRKVAILFNDITENKRTTRALIESEKLASVGRLASTIAHEINNPLEAVGNAIYLAQTDPETPSIVKSYLDMASEELERVTQVTRQTLEFHHNNNTSMPIDLCDALEGVLNLYKGRLRTRDITIQRRYSTNLHIQGVKSEIQQIVTNLLSNSLDALPNGGRLSCHVTRSVGRGGSAAVRLTIADNGAGIDPKYQQRIFEPFFTTKEFVGTGLGLWITKQLAAKHGATIRVRSKLHKGTVFSIAFPIPDSSEADKGSAT